MRWIVVLFAVACVGAVAYRVHAERAQEEAVANTARSEFARLAAPSFRAPPGQAPILRPTDMLPGLGAIERLARHADEPPHPGTTVFADVGTPRQLRRVRRDIRRNLAALNRLSHGASPEAAARTLSQVYAASSLATLGTDGRRALAERLAGRSQVAQHVKVLGYDHIFVSHRRALAQVVCQISVRAPSGRYLARSPQTLTLGLVRKGGRWRVVRGYEAR